jgi:hypothetical protein
VTACRKTLEAVHDEVHKLLFAKNQVTFYMEPRGSAIDAIAIELLDMHDQLSTVKIPCTVCVEIR